MSRDGKCLDPLGSKARGVFLPVRLASDSIRISFQCYWTILQVGQDEWRYAEVIINYVGLRELGLRIKNFAQPGTFHELAADFEVDFIGR